MSQFGHLFQLIKSLNKPEKRYLQLTLSRNTIGQSNNYRTLFNLISAQSEYDEKKIKEQLAGHSLKKTLAVTKHYLYNLILRTLKNFHSEETIDMHLSEKIQQARLLFDKKLFAQCEKLVLKALAIAQKHEKHLKAIELLEIELSCLHAQVQVDKIKEKSEKYYRLKQVLLKKEEQLFYLRKLSYFNFVKLKTKWVRKTKSGGIPSNPFPEIKENKLLSTHASILYHQNLAAHYFSVNHSENALTQLIKLDTLFDRNPHLVNDHLDQYIALLNNMNLILMEKKNYKKILSNIDKLKTIPLRSVEKKIRILERVLNAEVNVYKNTGNYENAGSTIEQITNLLQNKKLSEVYRMLFHIELFNYYFSIEEYKTALKYLNYFLSESREIIRPDLQKTARLLNMLVHYKLGNLDYFESLLRSTKRFFKKIDKLDVVEKLVLVFFNKLVFVSDKVNKNALFSDFRSKLDLLKDEKILHETYFRNFYFSEWAEAEEKQMKYIDLVRKKHQLIKLNSHHA